MAKYRHEMALRKELGDAYNFAEVSVREAAERRISAREEAVRQAAHEAKISELRGKFGKDLTEEQLFAKELKTEDVKRKERDAKQITVYVFSIVGAIVLAIGGIALAGSGHIIIGLIGIVAGIVVFVKKWDIVEYFDKKAGLST